MAPKMVDLSGQKFGNWEALSPVPTQDRSPSKWLCRCVCGTVREVFRVTLMRRKCRGCGCVGKSPLRPYEALYNAFNNRTRRDVAISYEEFVKFTCEKTCHYCGSYIAWAKCHTSKNGSAYNLDRKDNDLGYTVENCVVCCKRCNSAKSDHFTYEEWVEIGDLIRRQNNRKITPEKLRRSLLGKIA